MNYVPRNHQSPPQSHGRNFQTASMTKLSQQKEYILSFLRSGKWVCGRLWLDRVKDDRKRLQELNETYMAEKGYKIAGQPCKGQFCGRKDCPLYARRAEKIQQARPTGYPSHISTEAALINESALKMFEEA